MQRALLTGATGFLGSNLLPALLKAGWAVSILKRPTSNLVRISDYLSQVSTSTIGEQSLESLFRENQFDMVVHCATNYGRAATTPIEVIEANLTLPLTLLQLSDENGVTTFVNTDTMLDKRVNYYTLSKNQFREWLKVFSDRLTCVNATLAHFYGPFDDPSKFITHTTLDLLNAVPRIDLTPGRQKRDFIYIDDVVSAFEKIFQFSTAMENGYYNFEVGTGVETEIKTAVELIKTLCANDTTQLNFGGLSYRPREVMSCLVNTEPLSQLGWRAQVDLRTGLKRTIEFEKRRLESKTTLSGQA